MIINGGQEDSLAKNLEDIMGYVLDVEDNEDYSTFQVLDSFVKNKHLVITGEDHRFEKFNTKLELKLAKYLQSQGYRYYLMEAGFASTWMLNRLLMGDTLIGNAQHNFYTKRFSKLFNGLKDHNATLDSANKIVAVGIDIERNVPLALKMLVSLLPQKPAGDSLGLFIESLKVITAIEEEKIRKARDMERDDDGDESEEPEEEPEEESEYPGDDNILFYFNMVNTVEGLISEYRDKEKEMNAFLGENQVLFSRVILELERWLVWIGYERKDMPQSWVYREQYMENNLQLFFKENPDARCFGQFGRCHITRVPQMRDCSFAFFNSLTLRVKTSVPQLSDGILSIGIFYPDKEGDSEWRDNGNISELARMGREGAVTLFTELEGYVERQLSDKFNMVMVMRDKRYSSDFTGDYQDYVNLPKKKSRLLQGMNFGVGMKVYDFSELRNTVGQNLSDERLFFEIGFYNHMNKGFCSKSTAFILPQQEYSAGDTGTIWMSGWGYKGYFGADLVRARSFDLIPSLGFGFEGLTLSYLDKSNKSGLFGENPRTEFKNPAFILDGRLEANLNVKRLGISLFGGYTLDVSKKKWRQAGGLVTTGPNTSLSGYYAGFALALHFSM
jgi:hypothetical protein